MNAADLTEAYLARIAGWEVMKDARARHAAGRVLSAEWEPPILRGVVQEGTGTVRTGLVLRGGLDVENLCPCRDSRQRGILCAHAIAVGVAAVAGGGRWPVAAPAPAPASSARAAPGSARPPAAARPAAQADRSRCLRRDASGEPVELAFILPPNLADAAQRGKITLVVEALRGGRRSPLGSGGRDAAIHLGPADAAVLDRLEALAGESPAMLVLSGADFTGLLPLLAGHPRVTLGRQKELEVQADPWSPALKASLRSDGEIELAIRPVAGGGGGGRPATGPVPLAGDWVFHADRGLIQPLALAPAWRGVWQGPLRIPRKQVPAFLGQDWPKLVATGAVEADFAPTDFTLEPAPPEFRLHLAGGLAMLTATLTCRYGSREVTPGTVGLGDDFWMPDPADSYRYGMRDLAAEQAAKASLVAAGFTGPDARGNWQLNGQEKVLTLLARHLPRWQREWRVDLEERLDRSVRTNTERVDPRFEVRSGGEPWFELGVTFATPTGETIPPAEIQRLLRGGQSHTRLRNGRFALIDDGAVGEFEEVLRDCEPEQRGGRYRLPAAAAGFLDATMRRQGWTPVAPAAWRERTREQAGEAPLECPPLGSLETVLRPYQREGVAWLHWLRRNGFGGILADEMGLGKTLQVLAAIAAQRRLGEPPGTPRAPWLVVCPTSLVFNWAAEAARFAPELKVLTLHGADRHERSAALRDSDLVITSYALLWRDAERYREVEFDTVVLDEAQHIKNRQTRNAQAVKSLHSRHRLVLTGTPLENSVLDLWSLFDFLMPGYLGGATDFRERYEVPITKARDRGAMDRLSRRVRPFLRRRLKREVAADLPARLEQVAWCELTPAQRSAYQQVFEATRREVLAAGNATEIARSRLLVLNALLRLRQICCDLRLLGVETAPEAEGAAAGSANAAEAARTSGKVELFAELLDEIVDGGHRVLVFSQFTTMLGLLRDRLQADGVEFCYLDGSTRDRGAEVARFQSRTDIPVFLISLKAGGTGLNLTGADTVVHFDPWWNPAAEDQATDRAHRIGQTRVVTSYKLITRGTIEEKILALQQRKREVIQAMLGEQEFAAGLSWSEIQELLS